MWRVCNNFILFSEFLIICVPSKLEFCTSAIGCKQWTLRSECPVCDVWKEVVEIQNRAPYQTLDLQRSVPKYLSDPPKSYSGEWEWPTKILHNDSSLALNCLRSAFSACRVQWHACVCFFADYVHRCCSPQSLDRAFSSECGLDRVLKRPERGGDEMLRNTKWSPSSIQLMFAIRNYAYSLGGEDISIWR